MDSRSRILSKVRSNQRTNDSLPPLVVPPAFPGPLVDKLVSVLTAIGGQVIRASNWKEVGNHLQSMISADERLITVIPELEKITQQPMAKDPHLLENVKLAVIRGHFAVAENGAVWVTSDVMGDRALPFICEQLALVVNEEDIVPTMYHAYERIGAVSQDFGTFIAGPSKTADIEQSLVLGAHGPKSMVLFVMAPAV